MQKQLSASFDNAREATKSKNLSFRPLIDLNKNKNELSKYLSQTLSNRNETNSKNNKINKRRGSEIIKAALESLDLKLEIKNQI